MHRSRTSGWRAGLAGLAIAVLSLGAAGVTLAPTAPAAAARTHLAVGRIPFTRADAESADGRSFTIAWSAEPGAGPVVVYARSTPQPDGPGGAGRLVGRGASTGRLSVTDLPPSDRWYFELRPAHGEPLVTADRSLHLATAPNFRDIGGYRTRDGRWVKVGLVYRSDELDRLSDADLAKLGRLAPALDVDLRSAGERQRGPDRLPAGAELLVADVIGDAGPNATTMAKINSPDAAADFLVTANRQFVSLPSARDAYGSLFARLQGPGGPIVYHCSAGKDRTGWATAVLLSALGVPRSTVMADYLASNGYLAEKNQAAFSRMPAASVANLTPIFTVRAAYLDAAFEEVDRSYGSFDRYLRVGLGIDDKALARLKARFLAGAAQPGGTR
jgi:protein-tyrosine phosphatase